MRAYISDPEDLRQDCTYQDTWDDMIINVSTISENLVSLTTFYQQYMSLNL